MWTPSCCEIDQAQKGNTAESHYVQKPKTSKSGAKSRRVVTRAWGRGWGGTGEMLVKGHRMSVRKEEQTHGSYTVTTVKDNKLHT